MLATCLAQKWEKRIYSNVNIYKYGKLISRPLYDLDSVKKLGFSWEPWMVIIDESGLNYSSRRWGSETNQVLTEVLFLIGKKNCSLTWIAQRFGSIDVNARDLADWIFKVRKIYRKGIVRPIFSIERQKVSKTNIKNLTSLYSWTFDAIEWQRLNHISYEQLSESRIKPTLKEEGQSWHDKDTSI